jgi:hypothetical protein
MQQAVISCGEKSGFSPDRQNQSQLGKVFATDLLDRPMPFLVNVVRAGARMVQHANPAAVTTFVHCDGGARGESGYNNSVSAVPTR